jgi:hypothetical protein
MREAANANKRKDDEMIRLNSPPPKDEDDFVGTLTGDPRMKVHNK